MGRILILGRLIRIQNLLITALTQAGVYFFVLLPALHSEPSNGMLPAADLIAILSATLLAAAGGYIVNDIFDADMDALNRPHRRVIGVYCTAQAGWKLYAASLGATLALAAWLASRHGIWPLLLLPSVCAALFLYAWRLKCTPLIGNLLVAILCALVPVVPYLGVNPGLRATPEAADAVFTFALFAGVSNLFREQVKDLEDLAGDAAMGCRTLPVVAGHRAARLLATAIGVALMAGLMVQYGLPALHALPLALALTATLVLNLFAVVSTARAQEKRAYARASSLIKWLIITGFLTLIIFQNT